MQNKRKYHIIIGSKGFFEKFISTEKIDGESFLELIKISDNGRATGQTLDFRVDTLIVKNVHYHGITEAAHDRIGSLIEEFTTEDAHIYVHNPPRVLREYLNDQQERSLIELDIEQENYEMNKDKNQFLKGMKKISAHIIGQKEAIEEIGKSLWYLTKVKRKKPYVIMLYGDSSLGKTEMVREVADKFFQGKCLEKHLSMFKNGNYSDYFFGDQPNRRSLGFELLERESNLIFLDELDKCPEHFFSAFYTLFDNVLFKDATYDVDITGTVIILTSNYSTKEEMQKQLDLPIFFRIDKFIHFDDFNSDTILKIVLNELKRREKEYNQSISREEMYKAVSQIIYTKGENARTIKGKVQAVIEEQLFNEIRTLKHRE